MTHDLSLKEIKKEWHGSLRSYVIGFTASLLLTAVSFFLVITRIFQEQTLIYTIIALAIVQAIIQLLFFLHIGQEEAKPRWATLILAFTILILLAIVVGSLWIMNDLNARMMPNMTMEQSHD
jgi:cytochrome o ubiquinol oxidase operon protein cyoD